jgi:hypothetical protein
MESYAIPLSLLGGFAFYLYVAWFAADRDNPRNAKKAFRNSLGLLAFSIAFAVLLVLPWALAESWSLTQVASADLPYRKMRTAIYAIYGGLSASVFGLIHAMIASFLARTTRVRGNQQITK